MDTCSEVTPRYYFRLALCLLSICDSKVGDLYIKRLCIQRRHGCCLIFALTTSVDAVQALIAASRYSRSLSANSAADSSVSMSGRIFFRSILHQLTKISIKLSMKGLVVYSTVQLPLFTAMSAFTNEFWLKSKGRET